MLLTVSVMPVVTPVTACVTVSVSPVVTSLTVRTTFATGPSFWVVGGPPGKVKTQRLWAGSPPPSGRLDR